MKKNATTYYRIINLKRAVMLAVALVGVAGLSLAGARHTSAALPQYGGQRNFGLSVHIKNQPDKVAYVNAARSANSTTVRDDFSWPRIEPAQGTYDWSVADDIMRTTAPTGMRVLAIADYVPKWASSCPTATDPTKCAPTNPADYASFASKIAARYKQGGPFWTANPGLPYIPLAGIEIWNEPNIKKFWANPNGADYAKIVKAAYPAIKAIDSSLPVLAGAMTNTKNIAGDSVAPVTYLQQMYAGGVHGYFDALSHHPYSYLPNQTAEAMLAYNDQSAWSQMAETNPSLRSVMTANNDSAKKIWATELGAPTQGTNAVSELEQSRLATQTVAKWKSYPWAGNFYWYTLHDDCVSTTDKECNFGILRNDNTQKPAYGTLKNAYLP